MYETPDKLREQTVICSKTHLDGVTHEQTVICRQLSSCHNVGARIMKRM